MNAVPLRLLRAVAAAATHASASGAARALHQSTSSVTRGIQAAESMLEVQLFERDTRGMVATPEAAVLVERVLRAQQVLHAASAGLRVRGAPASVDALPRLVTDGLLRALVARAEHSSESAAAASLGLSQPALHQALRKLEHLARLPLFERTRVGARLNESGQWLLLHAQQALAELRIGHEELARRGQRQSGGQVVIGALPMAGDVLVPRAVTLALRAQPRLDITVKDGTYESLRRMLRAAEVDFVVGPLRGSALPPDLREETLFVDRFVAVARSGHPLATQRRRPSLRQMARHPWVGPLPGTPAEAAFSRLFAEAGLRPPHLSLRGHSAPVVRSVLLSGDHVALLSPLQVHADVEAGLLVHLSEPIAGTERPIGIAQRAQALPSSACEGVLTALRQVGLEAARYRR
ncbi:MAG: LysR family transcriptional regulator [Burkholderiaceae bacterium]|nr:LysR family transcriptional regulator [Burkholderiaceae bacterium]